MCIIHYHAVGGPFLTDVHAPFSILGHSAVTPHGREACMVFKIISAVVSGGGIVALLLAGFAVISHQTFIGGTGAGWIRLASSLFLLAIFIILFDRTYYQNKA